MKGGEVTYFRERNVLDCAKYEPGLYFCFDLLPSILSIYLLVVVFKPCIKPLTFGRLLNVAISAVTMKHHNMPQC